MKTLYNILKTLANKKNNPSPFIENVACGEQKINVKKIQSNNTTFYFTTY